MKGLTGFEREALSSWQTETQGSLWIDGRSGHRTRLSG